MEKLASYEKIVLFNYNEELKLQLEVLGMKRKFFPELNLSIADTLNNIGQIYFTLAHCNDDLEYYKIAVKYYKDALEIKKSTLSYNDLSIADTINNLGNAYSYLDKDEALINFEIAMNIYDENLFESSFQYASILYNYGMLCFHLKDYDYRKKSRNYLEKALEIYMKTLSENHTLIVITLNILGLIWSYFDEASKAKYYYEKATEMKKKALPARQLSIAQTFFIIGECYLDLELYGKAKEYYEASLELYRIMLTENHSLVAKLLSHNGCACFYLREFAKAKKYFENSLEIYQKLAYFKKKQEKIDNLFHIFDNFDQMVQKCTKKKPAKKYFNEVFRYIKNVVKKDDSDVDFSDDSDDSDKFWDDDLRDYL